MSAVWPSLALLGLAVPAGLWAAGQGDLSWGWVAGSALAIGGFLWIHWTAHRLLESPAGRKMFGWNSLLRVAVISGALFGLARGGPKVLAGALAGYAFAQLPAAAWRHQFGRKRESTA